MRLRIVGLLFVASVFGVLLVFLSLPKIESRDDPRSPCKYNLKQIGLALHEYHDRYRCFPPASVLGSDGKPWHSWRALVLPYLAPDDLSLEDALATPNDSGHLKPSSDHWGGCHALFFDGTVRFIYFEEITPKIWRALLTRNGGEKIDNF